MAATLAASTRPVRTPAGRIDVVSTLEIVYTSILVASSLAIAWFAAFVVYRLYRGQR